MEISNHKLAVKDGACWKRSFSVPYEEHSEPMHGHRDGDEGASPEDFFEGSDVLRRVGAVKIAVELRYHLPLFGGMPELGWLPSG